MYGARRTKLNGSYKINREAFEFNKFQMEIDLTTEYLGNVTIFEGKINYIFAVYQLFHLFILFHQLQKQEKIAGRRNQLLFLSRMLRIGFGLRLYLYTLKTLKK